MLYKTAVLEVERKAGEIRSLRLDLQKAQHKSEPHSRESKAPLAASTNTTPPGVTRDSHVIPSQNNDRRSVATGDKSRLDIHAQSEAFTNQHAHEHKQAKRRREDNATLGGRENKRPLYDDAHGKPAVSREYSRSEEQIYRERSDVRRLEDRGKYQQPSKHLGGNRRLPPTDSKGMNVPLGAVESHGRSVRV